MKRLLFSLLLLGGLVLFPGQPAMSAPSSGVPLDSWVYPVLDKLAGFGLVEDAMQGSRPYTRLEAARQTADARRKFDDTGAPAVVSDLLRRLEYEFDDELSAMADVKPSSIRFRLDQRGESSVCADGTIYLPYTLTNVDDHAGNFELKAIVNSSRGRMYADADGDGLPDAHSPIDRTGRLSPGDDFFFVVSVPPSAADDSQARTATVSASAIAASERFLKFTPLRQARVSWAFRDGEDSTYQNNPARQFPLNVNNFGIEYAEGHNGMVVLESELLLGRFLVNVRPFLQYREGEGQSLRLLAGTAALGIGPLELSAGRQALWWGPGHRGSLILSNNAKPLDMVRLTNPIPAVLPWIFRHLGPFRFDFFLSRLEEERVVPEPYFGGLRVNFKPTSWFELGASRTVLFGGDGRPSVHFDDFLTIIGGENLGGDEDTSNQLASFDVRVKIPKLAGAELYAEYGGEDEADLLGFIPFISKKALLAGLYLPRIEPTGRLDLRLEYTDLNFQGNGPSWYGHNPYRSGYTYEGNILGHHVGGDARSYFAQLGTFLPADVTLTFSLDLQRRGDSLSVQEDHEILSLAVQWMASPGLLLHARYAHDRVENHAFSAGEDRTHHFALAGVDFSW